MSKTKKILIFLSFSAACWLIVAGWGFFNGRQGSSVNPVYNDVIHTLSPDAAFVYDYDGEGEALPGTVCGAILPSPAANSSMTARGMAALAEAAESRLVLVVSFGEDMEYEAATSWLDWQTPFGIIQVDGAAIQHLVDLGIVADSHGVKKSRDIEAFMPYFARYFPDKRVVPLVFDASAGTDTMRELMDRIAQYGDGYFVLFLTPENNSGTPLFSRDAAALGAAFGDGAYSDFGGMLSQKECGELIAVERVLQYDGNAVLSVMTDETAKDMAFDDIAVFFGKEE